MSANLHAVILAAIQSFRSTSRTDQTWSEQLAAHIHAAVAPHTDVARVLAELDRMAAEETDERAALHLANAANIIRAIVQSLHIQDGAES